MRKIKSKDLYLVISAVSSDETMMVMMMGEKVEMTVIINRTYHPVYMGWNSSVGIATCYGLDGPGIESRWGQDFPHPFRPTLRPSLLYNGYRVFLGGKSTGRGVDHSPPSIADVKERTELYLYSPSGPSWSVLSELCFYIYHCYLSDGRLCWTDCQYRRFETQEYLLH